MRGRLCFRGKSVFISLCLKTKPRFNISWISSGTLNLIPKIFFGTPEFAIIDS